MSLQEELQLSGDFNLDNLKDANNEYYQDYSSSVLHSKISKNSKERKRLTQTPTDFSEAETSSSGFSDETSNKSTQTDGRPGSFLCTIADGEDCKFSIYDDASPIDSRFRNRPEYRELFKEIFTVLKKAAESKQDGEKLPLFDDCIPISTVPLVPPVTPAVDDFPSDFTDDNQSVVSSAFSDDSNSIMDPATVIENPVKEELTKEIISEGSHSKLELVPYKKESLEYISVSVNVRKKNSSRKHVNKQFQDRSDSPILPLSPRISYISNRGCHRKNKDNSTNSLNDSNQKWNGTTLQFWSSNSYASSSTPSQTSKKGLKYDKNIEFKPSSASHDLHKLKKLDLSYAEVLRNSGKKKRESNTNSCYKK